MMLRAKGENYKRTRSHQERIIYVLTIKVNGFTANLVGNLEAAKSPPWQADLFW